MKRLLTITYWIVSILLMATVLTSLGYRFPEAVFIGTMFLPGALAAKFFLPKASRKDRKSEVKDACFIVSGILLTEILLFIIAHYFVLYFREGPNVWGVIAKNDFDDLPKVLINPVFIALILTVLAVGSHYFESWLDRKHPAKPGPITFTSERKPVTLALEEILYVESNDSVTTVVATEGRHFRNKTPISQWEAILDPYFIRIHRSYLVNRAAVTGVDVDILYVGDIQLPISRKYKDKVTESMGL
ncbi:MAG: LytTR family transcriptional regulator [Bacteroidales bacterium]|nr:LytTR family transcriptional regulator [Bacteroidales bacterium]